MSTDLHAAHLIGTQSELCSAVSTKSEICAADMTARSAASITGAVDHTPGLLIWMIKEQHQK